MKTGKYFLTILCITALMHSFAAGQDLLDELQRVGVKNIRNYVSPFFDDFSADLNSAFYHSANLHSVLGFDVGVKVGCAITTDAQRKYDFVTPDYIDFSGGKLLAGRDYDDKVAGAPTAVGDQKNKFYVRVKSTSPYYAAYLAANHNSDIIFQIPNGFDLGAVPMIMPQAAVGLPFGLEVILRFIPTVSATDAGKFNYMGFGLRYDIDKLLSKSPPVSIAVHFMTQKMNYKSKADEDIFSATGMAFGAEVSKRLLMFTIYGGLQIEKATFTLAKIDSKLTLPDGTVLPLPIPEQTFEGSNTSRATVGFRVLLAMVNVHAEYSIAKIPVLAAGIGVSLR
jgi:hypothetical protein